MKLALSSLSGPSSPTTSASSRLAACCRALLKASGSSLVGLARGCRIAWPSSPGPRLAGIERGQLGFEPADQHRQIVDRDPVLAGERAEREQPLLGALELLRLEGGRGERLLDLGARGIGLGQHALERLGDGREQLRRDGASGARSGEAPRRAVRRSVPSPCSASSASASSAAIFSACIISWRRAARALLLAGLRIEGAKLLQRVAQIVGIGARGGDPGLMARSLGVGLLPRRVGGGDARRLAAQAAEGIDQLAMAGRIDQGAVVMLAVDLDQSLPDLAQQLHAHAGVVDEGAASCRRRPARAARSARPRRRCRSRPGARTRDGSLGKLEDRRHLALRRALAHQRGIAAAAEGKREGIEQDRLAGAGLAGQRRQALAEFEIELVDQNDVADRQGG